MTASVSAGRAARARRCERGSRLLAGPPGFGKDNTGQMQIIAAEMGTSLRLTSGPAIQHAGDLAAILSGLQEEVMSSAEEIHRLARTMRSEAFAEGFSI